MTMRQPLEMLLVLFALGVAASESDADIPKPPVPPPNNSAATDAPTDLPTGKSAAHFTVRVEGNKDVSFLRIPRSKVAGLTNAKEEKKQSSWSPAGPRSIVAALAASIGLASVFLLRTNRTTKIAILFVAGMVVSGTVAEAWWNAPPPPNRYFPSVPRKFDLQSDFHGDVVIEFVDDGDIQLEVGTKGLPVKGGPISPR